MIKCFRSFLRVRDCEQYGHFRESGLEKRFSSGENRLPQTLHRISPALPLLRYRQGPGALHKRRVQSSGISHSERRLTGAAGLPYLQV